LTDTDYKALEKKMLEDPAAAIKELKESMFQREVLPMMQGMYAEIEGLKSQATKQSALSNDLNKQVYSKYERS